MSAFPHHDRVTDGFEGSRSVKDCWKLPIPEKYPATHRYLEEHGHRDDYLFKKTYQKHRLADLCMRLARDLWAVSRNPLKDLQHRCEDRCIELEDDDWQTRTSWIKNIEIGLLLVRGIHLDLAESLEELMDVFMARVEER